MIFPFMSARTPIGLDVGPRSVAAAQLARALGRPRASGTLAGSWRLEAAALIDRPVGAGPFLKDDEALRVAQVLQRQGFTGRDVVLAVPDQRLVGGGAATLDLPPRSSGAPLEQLARMEMSRAHRLEPSAFEMACWEVPGPVRVAEGSHMMAVACRHSDADEMIDGLEHSGLRTTALDVHAWAIARACRGALNEGERIAAVLDLTESAALLAIVHNGAPAYERLLADGALEHLRKAIRTRLGIDAALSDHIFERLRLDQPGEDGAMRDAAAACADHLDNLASELRTAIAYAEHRFDAGISRVLLHGSGAAIQGMQDRLSSLLSIPAQALKPADVVCVPQALDQHIHEHNGGLALGAAQSPALMAAIGLAMHSPRVDRSRRSAGGAIS